MKRAFLPPLILLLLAAAPAWGQSCEIGLYVDREGTRSALRYWDLVPHQGNEQFPEFSIYVLLFANTPAAGAAYRIEMPGLGADYFLYARHPGPDGSGLVLDEEPSDLGTNVALGQCATAAPGAPILVMEYVLVTPYLSMESAPMSLSANSVQDPEAPLYVTCAMTRVRCAIGPGAELRPVSVDRRGFSSVKALFH